METLTSLRNPLLQELRRAARRGGLTSDGDCLAESFHLLDEALRSHRPVRAVLTASSARHEVESRLNRHRDLRLVVLSDRLFQDISSTEASQGVLSLVEPPSWTMADLLRPPVLLLVLDGIQDPGNAGAVLRSAEAFGASGAVFLKGSASPYNPKALRASAGSVFRFPIVTGLEPSDLPTAELTRYAALPRSGVSVSQADLKRDCAVILGSEARGIRPELLEGASAFRIPTAGVESLNAAVAASIVLYEAQRQRGGPR